MGDDADHDRIPTPDEDAAPADEAGGQVVHLDRARADRRADPRSTGGGGGSVLGAAMLAVGEIIEPSKTSVEIEEEREDDGGTILDLPVDVDFGSLPELD